MAASEPANGPMSPSACCITSQPLHSNRTGVRAVAPAGGGAGATQTIALICARCARSDRNLVLFKRLAGGGAAGRGVGYLVSTEPGVRQAWDRVHGATEHGATDDTPR